ncbi:MAG: helix-turn-helix transcriptional regulator [Xanthobacteraceae bacterium]
MKPQFIKTDDGELVVLPRRDYEALVKRAKGSNGEDEGVARIVARSSAALDAGNDVELPASVAEAIARGENALRVIREWQGHTQMYLAFKTDIDQSTISALENGTRKGTTAVWKRLAAFLDVPIDLLIPD